MRRAAAAATAVLLLSGCGGASPAETLADRADAVTRAANDGDEDAFRAAIADLTETVTEQRDADELSDDQARRLLALAASLRTQADDVDPAARAAARAAAEKARVEAARKAAAVKAAAVKAAAEKAAREAAARAAAARADEGGDDGKGKGDGAEEGKGGKDAKDAKDGKD